MSRGPLRGGLRPVLTDSRLTSAARSVYGPMMTGWRRCARSLAGHLVRRVRGESALGGREWRVYEAEPYEPASDPRGGAVAARGRDRRVPSPRGKQVDARGTAGRG